MDRRRQLRRRAVRIGGSAAAVVAVTGLIYPVKLFAPVLSLGALYVLAVLPVAVLWGLAYAVPVSVASMVAFNFFHLPPLHTFRLAESENWFALGVYLVTAIVVSELATRARRRAVAAERLAQATREAAALRETDAVKTAVLHAVSHDLRSPLTAISTASGLLRTDGVALGAADRAELAATIADESARLERLVENLLDLSRLEAGAAVPTRELWTLDALVEHVLAELPDSERVVVSIPAVVPVVSVDAAQVQRVLLNLLENALKFAPGKPVALAVERAGPDAFISVRDHGPGLPDGDLVRIFEPFEHGTDSAHGAGLGLAIARGFAEANGGRLWAERLPGGGAGFTVALPVSTVVVPTPT